MYLLNIPTDILVSYQNKGGYPEKGSLLVSVTSVVRRPRCALLTQTQSLNDSTVAVDVAVLQIVEERTALTYEHYERALSAIIFTVCAHVFRQMGNTV